MVTIQGSGVFGSLKIESSIPPPILTSDLLNRLKILQSASISLFKKKKKVLDKTKQKMNDETVQIQLLPSKL